jgi:DNA helicase II / ATP-dependent DNA helicase PcrA
MDTDRQLVDALRCLLPDGFATQEAQDFLHGIDEAKDVELVEKQQPYQFRHRGNVRLIDIDIKTIHQVKGQTHQATLVLETFWHEYNLQQLLPFLVGDPRPNRLGIRMRKRLCLTYVAMTRPTDLLCLAMHKQHLNAQHRHSLAAKGWRLQEL